MRKVLLEKDVYLSLIFVDDIHRDANCAQFWCGVLGVEIQLYNDCGWFQLSYSCEYHSHRDPSKREIQPLPNQTQKMELSRSDPTFAPVRLVSILMPEQSTEIGDLIHPVPGVLYQDSKLKKGDPKRYQTGMARYINFHDETRPLKPIARSSDFAVLRTAQDLLRISKDYYADDYNERDPQIPKLHRLARIPPIMSASSTSST